MGLIDDAAYGRMAPGWAKAVRLFEQVVIDELCRQSSTIILVMHPETRNDLLSGLRYVPGVRSPSDGGNVWRIGVGIRFRPMRDERERIGTIRAWVGCQRESTRVG